MKTMRRMAVVTAIFLAAGSPAPAQLYTNNASGLWSNTAVWASGLKPPTGGGYTNTLVFTNGAAVLSTNNIADASKNFVLNQLIFTNSKGALTIFGGVGTNLVFTNNGATLPRIWQNATNTLTFNHAITLATNTTFLGSGNQLVTLNSNVTGVGTMIVNLTNFNAAGNLQLSASNSFLGGIIVSNGAVNVNNANALGTNTATVVNGGLFFRVSNGVFSNNFIIGGTGAGSGALRAVSNSTVAGTITLATNATLVNAAATVAMAENGAVNLNSYTLTLNPSGSTNAINGAVSGTGGVLLGGTGLLVLTNLNIYSGGTTINTGTVFFANSSAVPASGFISNNVGGALLVTGAYNNISGWLGSGRLATNSAGALALVADNAEAVDLTAFANLSIGAAPGKVVTFSGSLTPGSNGYYFGGGGGTITSAVNNLFTGAGVNVTLGRAGSGGTTVLAANNDASGILTNASGNTLWLGNGGSAGGVGATQIVNAGTLYINRSDSFTNSANIISSSTIWKTNNNELVLTGTNTFSGALYVVGGAVTLPEGSSNYFNNTDFRVGNALGAGSVTQLNGNVTLISGGAGLCLGSLSNGYGVYTLNGGTLQALTTGNRGILVGVNSDSTGRFNFVSGVVTGNQLQVSRADSSGPRSVGYYYQSGGTAGFASLWLAGGSTANSATNQATFHVSNGTFYATAFSGLSSGNASTSTMYLGQGAQVSLPAFPATRGTNAYADITFDGGTLIPLVATNNYMSNLTYAFITINGATFNVGTGRDITIAQVLENAAGQNGVLTKLGGGALTLNGANSYSGGTTINGGLLVFGAGALPGTGNVLINSGGALAATGAYANVVDWLGSGRIDPSSAGAIAMVGDNAEAIDFATGGFNNLFLGMASGSTGTFSGTWTFNGTTYRLGGGGGTLNYPFAIGAGSNVVIGGVGGVGTVILTNINTHDFTTINSGTLNINADAALGTLPGSAATNLTFNGNSTLQFAGSFEVATNRTMLVGSGVTVGFEPQGTTNFIPGVITGSGGINKLGAGVLVLSGANDYAGNTTNSAGALALGADNVLGSGTLVLAGGALVSADASTRTVTNNLTFMVDSLLGVAGTGNLVITGVSGDLGTGTRTLTISNSVTTINNVLSNTAALVKAGPGTLVLGGANTYGGSTTIRDGTVQHNIADALPTTTALTLGASNSAANLNLNGYNQTVASLTFKALSPNTNVVTIMAGNTLAVTNAAAGNVVTFGAFGSTMQGSVTQYVNFVGGGSLAVNAPSGVFTVEIVGTNSVGGFHVGNVDLSGLANFTANVSNFYVAANGASVNSPFRLDFSFATNNLITATRMLFGTAGSSYETATNYLGQFNTWNASNIVVGGGRQNLYLTAPAGSNPQLTINGFGGSGTRANLYLGNNAQYGGGSSTASGTVDMAGGTVTGLLNNLILGYGGNGVSTTLRAFATGLLILDGASSTVDVNNLILGDAANFASTTNSKYTAAGMMVMSNGSLKVNTAMVLGQNEQAAGTYSQTVYGAFSLYGGSAVVTPGIVLGTHTAASPDLSYVTGAVVVAGGSLTVGGDITNGIGNTYASLTLAGGLLDMAGNKIGSATKSVDELYFQSGTLRNVGQINDGNTPLVKTTAGTLLLDTANAYTGGTTISNGTLLVNNPAGSGLATGPGTINIYGGGTLQGTGTVANVVVNSLGRIIPGNSIGTLTVSNLTMNSGSQYDYEFNMGHPQTNDWIIALGNVTINGGAFNFYEEGTTTAYTTNDTYKLIQASGPFTGSLASLSVNTAPYKKYMFNTNGVWLTVTIEDATYIWNGSNAVASYWSSNDNWQTPPVAGVPLVFDGSLQLINTNDLAANIRFAGITFSTNAGAFVLEGNAVNLTSAVENNSPNLQIINLPLGLDGFSRPFNTYSNGMVINGAIGETNGSWGVIKNGVYTLTLTASNTFTGGVVINGGALLASNAYALGPGMVAITNGVLLLAQSMTIPSNLFGNAGGYIDLGTNILTFSQGGNSTFAGAITNTGGVIMGGTGTLTLTGTNTYSGGTIIAAGAIQLGDGVAANGVVVGAISNDARLVFANPADQIYGGVISGTGTVTKLGAGTLVLSGANSYSGYTTNQAGTLALGADNVLGTGILVMNGGTLASDGATARVLTNAIQIPANGQFGQAIGGTGDLNINGYVNLWGGTRTLTVSNLTTVSGTVSNGGLTKAGSGTLVLAGSNTYIGITTINNGTLKLGHDWAMRTVTNLTVTATGVLDLNGYNATVGNMGNGASTALITNSAAGSSTNTLTITNLTSGIATLIADGATRRTAVAFNNSNGAANVAPTNGNNTFSGGLILLGNGAANGARLALNASTPLAVTNAGGIVNGPFGTGPIIVGQSPADKAGIYISGATTLFNAIIVNSGLGTDVNGTFRFDAAATVAGTITANLADVQMGSYNGSGVALLAGQVTGPYGLHVINAKLNGTAQNKAVTVTLSNITATANDYAGPTIIDYYGTLALGLSDQIPNGVGKGDMTNSGTFKLNGNNETINGLVGTVITGVVDGVSGTPVLTVGDNDATASYAGTIKNTAGTLTLVKIGSGVQTLSGSNTYSGNTIINAGVLQLNHASAARNSTISNLVVGGLQFGSATNAYTIGGLADTFDVVLTNTSGNGVTLSLGNNGNSLVFTKVFSDAGLTGAVNKVGSGDLTLTGTNTYTGGTIVSGGRLLLNDTGLLGPGTITLSGGALASDGATPRLITNTVGITTASSVGDAVNNGLLTFAGIMDLNNATRGLTNQSDILVTGVITNGGLNKRGAGTLTFRGTANINATSEINGGMLIVDGGIWDSTSGIRPNAQTPGDTTRLVITNNGTVYIHGSGSSIRIGYDPIANTTNIVDIYAAAISTNATTQQGMIFRGTNGPINIVNLWAGGVLTVNNIGVDGTGGVSNNFFNFNGGILRASANDAMFMTNAINAIVLGGGAIIDDSGKAITIAANLQGTPGDGGLIKLGAGTLALVGSNTYSGGTTISAGTLQAANAAALPGYATAGKLAVSNGAMLAVNYGGGSNWTSANVDNLLANSGAFAAGSGLGFDTSNGNGEYTNAITISGLGLTKLGANTLILSGTNSFTGVTLSSGTLSISSDTLIGGASVPLTFSGGILQLTGTTQTNLDTHPVNWSSFNGGFDIADAANIFTVNAGITSGGALTKLGAGNLVLNGTTNILGAVTTRGGMLVINGPTLATNGNPTMLVGTNAGDRSVVILNTNLTAYKMFIGNGTNASGAVIQNGGVVTVGTGVGGTSVLDVGRSVSNGYGYYQMNGGQLITGQLGIKGSTGGTGVFDLNGGTVNVDTGWLLFWGVGNGVLNIANGSMSSPSANGFTMGFATGASFEMVNLFSNGVLNSTANGKAVEMMRAVGTGLGSVINLNGGTLMANKIQASTNGQTLLNFNGGTLLAGVSSTTFLQGLSNAIVYAGGATIDSSNFNITVAQNLLAPTGSGVTNITLSSGGAGYIGAPVVVISGGGGIGATAIAQVDLNPSSGAYGQVTNLLITSTGFGYTSLPSVTLTGGGSTSAATIDTIATNSSSVSGGLTKLGAGVLTLSGTNTYNGVTDIRTGTLTITSTNALPGWNTAGRYVVSNGAVLAVYNAVTDDSITNMLGTGNFASGSYLGFDTTNGNRDYRLVVGDLGANVLGVVKLGANNLALSNANTYSGGTLVNGSGLVIAANGAALGSGPVTVTSGAGLAVTNSIVLPNNLTLAGTGPSGNGALRSVDNVNTIGGVITLSTNAQIQTYSGSTLYLTNVINNGGYALNLVSSGDTIVSGSITNSGSLTKNNAGTLTLAAANTYSGGTIINSGILLASNANALGTGYVAITNSTLRLAQSTTLASNLYGNAAALVDLGAYILTVNQDGSSTFAGVITNAGALAKGGAGTLTLTGTNTYTGPTVINGGTLKMGGVGLLGGTNGTYAGSITNNATLIFGGSSNQTLSGVIAGSGLLMQSNSASTLTLSGTANTYNGLTVVAAGILSVSDKSALGSAVGGTVVSNGARLWIKASMTNAEPITLTGDGTGTGASTYGALLFNLNTGVFKLQGPITLAGGAVINSYAAGTSTITFDQGIAGTGDLTFNIGAANNGNAIYVLNGQSSYDGNTYLKTIAPNGPGITVQLGINNGLPVTTVLNLQSQNTKSNRAALMLNGYSQTLAGLISTNTVVGFNTNAVVGGSATLSTLTINNSANYTFDGQLGGTGANENNLALIKTGSGTLTLVPGYGPNTYTGGTIISNGTLKMGVNFAVPTNTQLYADTLGVFNLAGWNQQVSGIDGSKGIFTDSVGGGSLTVNFANTQSFPGQMTGPGNLMLTGGGTLNLTGTNSFSGNTVITNATLLVNGLHNGGLITVYTNGWVGGFGPISSLLVNGGVYSPGSSPGTQLVAKLSLTNFGRLVMDLGTNGYDQVTVTNSLVLAPNSLLQLALANYNYSVAPSKIVLVDWSSAGYWNGTSGYDTNQWFTLSDAGGPQDMTILTNGTTFAVVGGNVATNYFNINYDDTAAGHQITLTAVPEPGTASLLGVAGLALLVRRLRRRQQPS